MRIEVRKDGLRQTQDGTWKLSLTVLPEDMPVDLMTAPMGKIYNIDIQDAEEEVDNAEFTELEFRPIEDKPKRFFKELPLSQQAALKCLDSDFQEFMHIETRVYKASPEGARAAIIDLCELEDSRSELDTKPASAEIFRSLLEKFEAYKLEQQYKDNLGRLS